MNLKFIICTYATNQLFNYANAVHYQMNSHQCETIPKQKPKSIVLQCPMMSTLKHQAGETKRDKCQRAGCCFNKFKGRELCWTNKATWEEQKKQKIRLANNNKFHDNTEKNPEPVPQIPVATLQKLKEQEDRRKELAILALEEAELQAEERHVIEEEEREIEAEISDSQQNSLNQSGQNTNNDDDNDDNNPIEINEDGEHRVSHLVNFGSNTEETMMAIKRQDDSQQCLNKIQQLMISGQTKCLAVVPPAERTLCDVRAVRSTNPELSLCSACLRSNCCYDPTPRITHGRLTPMCYHPSNFYQTTNNEFNSLNSQIEKDLMQATSTTEATTTISPEKEYSQGVMKGHGHATVAPDMMGKKYEPKRDNRYQGWIKQNYNLQPTEPEQPVEISEAQSKMSELLKNNPRLAGKFGSLGLNINKPVAPKPSSSSTGSATNSAYNDRMKAFMSMHGTSSMPSMGGMGGLPSAPSSSGSNAYMDKIRAQFMGGSSTSSSSSNPFGASIPGMDKMELLQSILGGKKKPSSSVTATVQANQVEEGEKEPEFTSKMHEQMYKQLMSSFENNLRISGKSSSAMERDMATFRKTVLKRFEKYLVKEKEEEKESEEEESTIEIIDDEDSKTSETDNSSENGSINDISLSQNSQTSRFIPFNINDVFEIGNDEPNNCYPSECGVPELDSVDYLNTMKKIVGGTTAGSPQFWPWQVSIRRIYANTINFSHLCGGTLISNRWILTAAHCFIRYTNLYYQDGVMEDRIDQFMIHVGRYHKSEIKGEEGLQMRTLEKYIAHEQFSPTDKNQINDIALGKMAYPIMFTEHVRPACLPSADSPPKEGDRMWITGWGDDMNVGPSNNVLKELSLPVASVEMCRNDWKSYYNDGWICSDRAYKEDACTGDSGGPAVHKSTDGRWRIVGITAAGSMKCSTTMASVKAGVFTNVVKFRQWIDANTGSMC